MADTEEALVKQGRLTLTEDEAIRFLAALNEVNDESVVRLRDLHRRLRKTTPQ